MTQRGGSHSSGAGTDIHIPAEILAVIPTDPHEQLDLARRITSQAIAARVSQLESETGRLRRQAADKDRLITDLQEKVSRFESTSQTAEARLRAALQENDVLSKERDSLAVAAKKLARDLTKISTRESLKQVTAHITPMLLYLGSSQSKFLSPHQFITPMLLYLGSSQSKFLSPHQFIRSFLTLDEASEETV